MAGIGREVGVVFDDAEAQLIFSTVEEEVASGLENLGLSRDEMHRRFHTVMEATGISDLADRAPHTLSGGQKQRVAIAATSPSAPASSSSTSRLLNWMRQPPLR